MARDNPYPDEPNPRAVHAIFLSGEPGPEVARAGGGRPGPGRGERAAATPPRSSGARIFLHTPDGYGRSDLAAALVKLGQRKTDTVTGTARNWATVTKLLAMCGD